MTGNINNKGFRGCGAMLLLPSKNTVTTILVWISCSSFGLRSTFENTGKDQCKLQAICIQSNKLSVKKRNTKLHKNVGLPLHHSSLDFKLSLWIRSRSHPYCQKSKSPAVFLLPCFDPFFKQWAPKQLKLSVGDWERLFIALFFNGSTAVHKSVLCPFQDSSIWFVMERQLDNTCGSVSDLRRLFCY